MFRQGTASRLGSVVFECLEPRVLLSGAIAGHVYNDANGMGLGGISVEVFEGSDPNHAGEDAWNHVATAATDAGGAFVFSGLEAQHYRLRVNEGQQSGAYHYLGGDRYDVVVIDDQTAGDQDFALRQAASIWGYVENQAGQPVKNAEVLVEGQWTEQGEDWHRARTDSSGRYEVFLAETGQDFYPIRVLSAYDPGATYKVYGSNDPDALTGDWRTLYRDLDPQVWTFLGAAADTHTFAGGYLSYVLRSEFGYRAAVDAIEAGAGNYSGYWVMTGNVTNWQGVLGAPDGQYALTNENPYGDNPDPSYLGFGYTSAPTSVTIHIVDRGLPADPVYYGVQIAPDLYPASLTGTRGPDFSLSPGGLIWGRVTNSSGEPLRNLWNALEPWAVIPNGMWTDAGTGTQESGRYYLPSVPAGIDVWGETADWPWQEQGYEQDGVRYAAGTRYIGPYSLNPGEVLQVPDIVVLEAARLWGVVRDGGGTPLDGAEVHLTGFDLAGGALDSDNLYATTEADGSYEFLNAPAGQLWVTASKDGFAQYVSGSSISAAPGQEVPFNITLAASGAPVTVTGSITNFDDVAPTNDDGVVLPFNTVWYENYGRGWGLQVMAYDPAMALTADDYLEPVRWVAFDTEVEDGYDDYFVPNPDTGTFSIQVAPGQMNLFVVRGAYSSKGSDMGVLSDPLAVNGAPGQTIAGQDLSIPHGTASVQGQFLFPTGYPGVVSRDSAVVWLEEVGGSSLPRAVSWAAPSGEYAIEGLPAGTYYVYAVARGLGTWTSPQFTVGPGQTVTQNILFDMQVPFEIELRREIDYEVPGTAVDNAYQYALEIAGFGLTEIELTTPWEQVVRLSKLLPPGWNGTDYVNVVRGALEFEAYWEDGRPHFQFSWGWLSDNQWASLDDPDHPTVLAVTYGNGSWVRALDFSGIAQDDREPAPVSPVYRKVEPSEVEAQWAPWTSAGPDSVIVVDVPDCVEEELAPSAVSWKLPLLPPKDGLYEFEIAFGNRVTEVVEGVTVRTGAFTENDVRFKLDTVDATMRVHPVTGHVYFLTPRGTWPECQAFAAAAGGNLVTLNDAAEEAWLREQYGGNAWFWLGFNDVAQEGTWVWASGEPVTYTNWAPGQPNNGGGQWEEDAAVTNWTNSSPYSPGGGTQWNDVPLDHYYPGNRGIVELPAGSTPRFPDDHGNTFDQATLIGTPTRFTAALAYTGDIDFFRFNAVQGQTYDILVSLPQGQLEDSTLWLYGTDGRTMLAQDDDGSAGWGSRIVWTAPASGTYYLAVDACELENHLGEYTVQITLCRPTADTPDATFQHPGRWLVLGDGRGIAVSDLSTGAAPSDAGQVLHLLDLTDPLAPIDVGAYFAADIEGGDFADDLQRLYLGDDSNVDGWIGHAELVSLDVSGPGDPREVYRVLICERDVDSVEVAGGYLYAGTQPEDESIAYLEVYDISDPSQAVLVGESPPMSGGPGRAFDPEAIAVGGGRAFILHEGPPTISILDVSDPTAPALLGQILLPGVSDQAVGEMAASGDTVLVGADWDVLVLDVSDPAHPQLLATLPMGGEVGQIVIDAGLAYVGIGGLGAAVVDIADPRLPCAVRTYLVTGATGSVAVAGGYVYIPADPSGVAVFAVSPPAAEWIGGADTDWGNAANWSPAVVPGPQEVAVFDAPAEHQPALDQDQAVLGLDFHTAGWTLSLGGNTLAVGEGGIKMPQGAAPTSTIDLGTGNLIVDYPDGGPSPMKDVLGWVKSGLSGGPNKYWDGPGITSSAARDDAGGLTWLAVVDNNNIDIALDTLEGEDVSNGGSYGNVLVKYTYLGDNNLNGYVDWDNDFLAFQNGVLFGIRNDNNWLYGDYDYSGAVDWENDFLAFQNGILFQGGPLGGLSGQPLREVQEVAALPNVTTADLLAAAAGRVPPPPLPAFVLGASASQTSPGTAGATADAAADEWLLQRVRPLRATEQQPVPVLRL